MFRKPSSQSQSISGTQITSSQVPQGQAGQLLAQNQTGDLFVTCAYTLPWNYAKFLDYCVERWFLQRIGDRYRFLHRALLEHFADKAGGIS